jgi:hypothetical protein
MSGIQQCGTCRFSSAHRLLDDGIKPVCTDIPNENYARRLDVIFACRRAVISVDIYRTPEPAK